MAKIATRLCCTRRYIVIVFQIFLKTLLSFQFVKQVIALEDFSIRTLKVFYKISLFYITIYLYVNKCLSMLMYILPTSLQSHFQLISLHASSLFRVIPPAFLCLHIALKHPRIFAAAKARFNGPPGARDGDGRRECKAGCGRERGLERSVRKCPSAVAINSTLPSSPTRSWRRMEAVKG